MNWSISELTPNGPENVPRRSPQGQQTPRVNPRLPVCLTPGSPEARRSNPLRTESAGTKPAGAAGETTSPAGTRGEPGAKPGKPMQSPAPR